MQTDVAAAKIRDMLKDKPDKIGIRISVKKSNIRRFPVS